ncbi:IS4 family transposase [Bacillus infantis]|uniref:IS4 family transposase n=1 Tax=Bacillus infantis TaxID=324767 RepID=UPI00101B854F|nr:IS4 family transposase [Bacillus infantis]RYI24915.1 IS4 family transposase [Bacillus infantis]
MNSKSSTPNQTLPDSTVVQKCLALLNLENYRDPFMDHRVHRLFSGHVITMAVEGMLMRRESLWDLSENLKSKKAFKEMLELKSIHGSSIYRKLEKLPTGLLQETAFRIFKQIDQHHKRLPGFDKIGKLAAVDSSQFSLPSKAGEWAYSTKKNNGVKLHLCLIVAAEDTYYPGKSILSTTGVDDKEVALELVVDQAVTYIYDRGYISYTLYSDLIEKNLKFVARVKMNSKLTIVNKYDILDEPNIVLDAEVQVKKPKTEETIEVRLIEFLDDEGNKYRVVTNRRDLTASEVAEIYRQRWKVELFFKWIKQHLKLVKFYSHKKEAVWNQLWLAMIAYGLCELVRIHTGSKKSTWEILKYLRQYWYDSWDYFIEALFRKPSRTSKGRRKKGKPGRKRKYPKKLKTVQIVQR